LVGSVSNGKTTLVEKLTGMNTKRHSKELKEGRTIQLGYANLLLWKCTMCGEVVTTGQKIQQRVCDYCSNACQVEFELSLVDAPGHSAYIKTMIRGSSIMEAAIVVTDVKQIPHQTQTLEHLAILEILGVKRVLVVQNKCDLVTADECLAHYTELKAQFSGTLAAQAPVVPICAQRGLNVSVVMAQIYNMCLELQHEVRLPPAYEGFAIIRSFDINKPDTGVMDLKGGVIGGCVVGTRPICVGDQVEIRPGLIQPDNTFLPLRTKVLTIFSEQKSVQSCEPGGLFALGTNLDPAATKSDRLVGSVAGLPHTLPPVVSDAILRVVYVTLDKNKKPPKLSEDHVYFFVWGNLVVKGHPKTMPTKHTFRITYDQPMCSYVNRCIIYGKKSDGMALIGFGTLV
jgi:translation initiation factor 2 subunit 3